MTTAGDDEASPEPEEHLPERVAALELQVADLNHQLDNLTTEFVRLRLKLESTKTSLEDSLAEAAAKPKAVEAPFFREWAAAPPPPPPPVLAAVSAPPPSRNLEERLGSQVFNAIGILAILCGASYGLKAAIEHGLIGPVGRILIGLATGSGLILWSERFRRKGFAAFSYSLKGVGSALLYLSLWAAFHLYGLMPAPAALTAMIVVTFWNAFMAWNQNAELLAVYALLGGFLTPLLLSTGGNHEGFLFTYMAVIDLALVVLLRTKPWGRLVWIAFPATVIYYIGWCSEFFHRGGGYWFDMPGASGWDRQSTETALFAILFAALFASVHLAYPAPDESEAITDSRDPSTALAVLLPLANAVFLGAALRAIFVDSGLDSSLPWIAVALSAVYLGLMRLQATAVARAVHLAIAVVFLTIAIPLKASGHTLTTAWLVEGLVLFWLSTRFSVTEEKAARLLRGLSASGYALGLGSLCYHWAWASGFGGQTFFSREFAAALIAVAALAGAIFISAKAAAEDRQNRRAAIPVFLWAFVGINFVGVLLTSDELLPAPHGDVPAAFANAGFGHALVGLAILAAAVWTAYRLAQQDRRGRDGMLQLTGVTLVIFNLAAILSIEREIGALFHAANAGLARSLAISAFLMLYGAALLALGFWRRAAFIRWQALILLLFTIGKVFLYDTVGLSQGYRVASFVALGVLLMTVSFAYQKDWLNLKNPPTEAPGEEAQ